MVLYNSRLLDSHVDTRNTVKCVDGVAAIPTRKSGGFGAMGIGLCLQRPQAN